MLDIIIPTLYAHQDVHRNIISTSKIGITTTLHIMTERVGWPRSINQALIQCSHDVLIMDDDVLIHEDIYAAVQPYIHLADIFGFKLYEPHGPVGHAGCYFDGSFIATRMGPDCPEYNIPSYCAHVTASLMYIKREVIATLGGIDETYPGIQFEDVDLTCRAIIAGFRVAYIPATATHFRGQTKSQSSEFFTMQGPNAAELSRRHFFPNSPFLVALRAQLGDRQFVPLQ